MPQTQGAWQTNHVQSCKITHVQCMYWVLPKHCISGFLVFRLNAYAKITVKIGFPSLKKNIWIVYPLFQHVFNPPIYTYIFPGNFEKTRFVFTRLPAWHPWSHPFDRLRDLEAIQSNTAKPHIHTITEYHRATDLEVQ